MIEKEVYKSTDILQSYRDALNEALLSINPNHKITDRLPPKEIKIDFHTRNYLIKNTFYKGYDNAKEIASLGTDKQKSELERILNNIIKDGITVSAYGNPDTITYNEFQTTLYDAYFGGAYTALRKPYLSEKEKHEELIKMVA